MWLKSKNSNEFVTTSTDGGVIWWELQDPKCVVSLKEVSLPVPINREPNKILYLENTDDKGITKNYGGTRIDNTVDAGAAKFLIGTEQGILFVVNKKKQEGEIGQKIG